jgi:hypothetical protein
MTTDPVSGGTIDSLGSADGIRWTWLTRRFPRDLQIEWGTPREPSLGDVLLCEVRRIGIHGRVETPTGSRRKLYRGDRVVCVVGNRYATAMLEAVGEVHGESIDLASASGVCGRVISRSRGAGFPTRLSILGQAFSGGMPVNVRSYALDAIPATAHETNWVVVVGSAMDSGKTTACASLIHGLAAGGRSVGAAKLTGTASARDFGAFRDAGASQVLDFLDAGWVSTAGCSAAELGVIRSVLTGHLRGQHAEWGVLEIADGILQVETNLLLESMGDALGSSSYVLTVGESLAAVAGVRTLRELDLDVTAVSGLVTNSPLACREVEEACGVPCIRTAELGARLTPRLTGAPLAPDQPPTLALQ